MKTERSKTSRNRDSLRSGKQLCWHQ